MAAYLTMRIEEQALNYNVVKKRFTKYMEDIDIMLAIDGYAITDDGWAVKVS